MRDDESTLRDSTLRRIGRNVVNFQRLEAALKSLIPAMNASGDIDTLHKDVAARAKSLKKKPLGTLATTFASQLFDGHSRSEPPTSISTGYIRFSFSIETDSLSMLERTRALLSLVRERNSLVHSQLKGIDFDVPDDCERLSASLDEQNARICEQLEFLKQVDEMRRSQLEEFKRFVESEAFLEALGGAASGA